MNQRQPASNGRRQLPGQVKTARPNVHRRVPSYHNAHSQTHAGTKVATVAAKKAVREEVELIEDDEVMAGLPQFCMTCERQIVNPGNSTLFCSRACQRRDSAKTTTIEPLVSPAFISAPSYFDVPQPDILPQRSPTVLRPVSLTFSDWDPRTDSIPELGEDADSAHSNDQPSTFSLARRPQANLASTSTLPSLSHTPSSSVGTAASFTSMRRLHSRHDPTGCHHHPKKSADLVIPTFAGPSSPDTTGTSVKSSTSTLTSFQAVEAGNLSYMKQGPKKQSPASGSLKQLFEHAAMSSTSKGNTTGYAGL